jgi:hypothetical protein
MKKDSIRCGREEFADGKKVKKIKNENRIL